MQSGKDLRPGLRSKPNAVKPSLDKNPASAGFFFHLRLVTPKNYPKNSYSPHLSYSPIWGIVCLKKFPVAGYFLYSAARIIWIAWGTVAAPKAESADEPGSRFGTLEITSRKGGKLQRPVKPEKQGADVSRKTGSHDGPERGWPREPRGSLEGSVRPFGHFGQAEPSKELLYKSVSMTASINRSLKAPSIPFPL